MASLLNKVGDAVETGLEKLNPAKPQETPPDVKKRLKRGKDRLRQLSARRRESIEFANNNHFVNLNADSTKLVAQSLIAISEGGDKPDHRVRRSHDLIGPIVKKKISAATQRVPSYEVIAATPDPEDFAAAKVAENVALAGYEIWHLKRAAKKLVWNALVTEEAFIMPRWDSSVGPFIDVSRHPLADAEPEYTEATIDPETGEEVPGQEIPNPYAGQPDPENPQWVGMGEIDVSVWGGLEVLWEPGVEFEKSRWYAIESARPCDVVEEEEGFIGGDDLKLRPDAETSNVSGPKPTKNGQNLVMVTEYLERPCPKWPQGRRLIFANDREIFPADSYPLTDHKGRVVDAPCIHRLSYAIDGSSDRDKGLVPSLIDAMRSYDMSINKVAEWIQIMLVPQWAAPEGSILTPPSDEPGLVIEYDVTNAAGAQPTPRAIENVPPELFTWQERSKAELGEISFDSQAPTGIESAKGLTAYAEQAQLAWQDFIYDLAEVHARVMRDCLTIVQNKYSEERMIQFRGSTGWENILDFRGADIRNQTDVRVSPGSLEPRTRASIESRIAQINNMFPGYFPPPVVISAMNSANPDKLIESYEKDEARAHRIISMIKTGEIWNLPPRPVMPGEEAGPELNPETGEPIWEIPPREAVFSQPAINELGEELPPEEIEPAFPGKPVMLTELPGWMPRPFDNVDIYRSVLEGWMKTQDFENLGEEEDKAAMLVYAGISDLEMKAAQRKAQLQTEQAESLGRENASKPTPAKPLPSPPSQLTLEEGAP